MPICRSAAQGLGVPNQAGSAAPELVAGRVVNGVSDAPLPRALVQLGSRAMLTDGEGRFHFEQSGQPVGSIRATKPGFLSSPEQNDGFGGGSVDAADATSVTVTLWPEALLAGRVLGPDGEPLPHIAVQARRSIFDEQGHRMQVSGQSQTDSHGQFRLPVPAGDYLVESQFSQRGFERDQAVMPVSYPPPLSGVGTPMLHVGPGEEQQMELRPQVSRTYVVTLPLDGEEGPPPRITARSSAGITFSANGFRSQAPGVVRINLPPGSYTLHAMRFSRDGVQFGDSSVTVPDHDVTGAPLHLTALPAIPVDLVADTSASSSAVRTQANPPNLMQFNLVLEPTDADPASPFQFGVRPTQQREGVMTMAAPPGSYRLSAGSTAGWYIKSAFSRGADLTRDLLVVSPSASPSPITLLISNQTGSVEGTAKLAGTPAACWIYLVANGPALSRIVIRRSDASGSFRITDLAPGSYRAVAFAFRHSADLEDPAILGHYATHLGSVSVAAGTAATLNLEAVTTKEMLR